MNDHPITRRGLLGATAGAASLLALSACGGTSSGGTSSGGTSSGGGASPAAPSSSEGPRTITHAMGTTQVPAHPQRVACLQAENGVDYLASVGIVPVAAAMESPVKELAQVVQHCHWPVTVDPSAIQALGNAGEINLEALAAAKPDLILGWDYQVDKAGYQNLSGIAPTVAILPYNGPEWRTSGKVIAHAVNREAEWAAVEESVKQKAKDLGATLPVGAKNVAYMMVYDPGEFYVYMQNSQPGDVLRLMGRTVVKVPGDAKLSQAQLSAEQLGTLSGADYIVVGGIVGKVDPLAELSKSAVWKAVPAVKKGHVSVVDQTLWSNGGPAFYRDLGMPSLVQDIRQKMGA